MPKILRIVNRFNLGGPTYNAAYLAKFLAPEFETRLIGGVKEKDEGSSEMILKNLGVSYEVLKGMQRSIHPLRDLKAYREIRQIIRDFKPDIIHTHAAKAGALGRLAAMHEKVPIIVHTFHGHVFDGYFGRLKTSFYKLVERKLALKTTAIVVLSKKQFIDISETHGVANPTQCHLIPLGFDLNVFAENRESKRLRFRQDWSLDDTDIAVGIIGRLTPIKNHRFFLRVIKNLKESGHNVKAFVIGDGEMMPDLLEFCAELNITSDSENRAGTDVIFTSWIHPVDQAIAGLDIVALTSVNEGTPVSLIEAMAGSKAVISTDAGGASDIVTNLKHGFIVPQNDLELYSARLKELASSERMRQTMGAAGCENAFERFHVDRLVSDMTQLYGQLLDR